MVTTIVTKWGNSLGIRIPRTIAAQIGVKENSKVTIKIDGDRMIVEHGQSLEEMLAIVTDENKHVLQDIGEPRGKELI